MKGVSPVIAAVLIIAVVVVLLLLGLVWIFG